MEFNVEDYLSNLSYINKDFNSIWEEILETVPKLTNKWIPSEANESDPLVVLLMELAIISDKLNYNVDKNILELFPATLTQLRSAYNVYESLGYTPDWYVSATTNVSVYYKGLVGGEINATSSEKKLTFTIPKFTQVSNTDTSVVFTTLEPMEFTVGTPYNFSVFCIEGTMNDFTVNGETKIMVNNLDSQNRLYFNEINIAQNGIIISHQQDFSDYTYDKTVSSEISGFQDLDYTTTWRRVDNLNQYVSGSKIYKIGIDSINNSVYIQFPSDIGDLIEDGIYIKYVLSSGDGGNVGKGDICKFANVTDFTVSEPESGTEYTLSATDDFTVVNTISVQNGRDRLDISEMRKEFNSVAGTFDTLVTLKDYESFIYNYILENGKHVVSNIRVSDRFHDLWDTLKYKSMDVNGDISDNVVVLTDEDVTPSTDLMSPFDLKLYPLNSVEPIETKEQFDESFNVGLTDGEILSVCSLIKGDDSSGDEEGILKNSKCISHSFTSPGKPILIPYSLSGQIYLQTSASSVEETEIMNNVRKAVYNMLNPRNLEWGEMLNYGDIVDGIKNSDKKIQYVALNPIAYESPVIPSVSGTSQISQDMENGFDITIRNILCGNKSWTTYSPYYYSYNQSDGNIFGGNNSVDQSEDNQIKIQSISTDIIFQGNEGSAWNSYKVGKGETISIIVPQYRTVTTYSNYLYFVCVGSSSKTIYAGVPTVIPNDCYINIFSNRTDAYDWIKSPSSTSKVAYKISSGTIINSSINLSFVDVGALTNESVQTLGSSSTISVVEKSIGIIQSSDSILAVSGGSNSVKVSTNSQGLSDSLKNGTEYTLLSDEYLFYTDSYNLELGIIGEGTTISTNGATIKNGIYVITSSNATKIIDGSLPNDTSLWTTVNSGFLSYTLNTLYTFGENYLVSFLDDGGNLMGILTTSTPKNEFFELTGCKYVVYALDNSESNSGLTFSVLPSLTDGASGDVQDSYKMLIRRSLVCGPGVESELVFVNENLEDKKGSVSLPENTDTTYLSEFSQPQRAQSIIINYTNADGSQLNKEITTSDESASILVQSSLVVAYQGGSSLQLVGEEQNIGFYYYSMSDDSLTVDESGFIDVGSIDVSKFNTINVPSVNANSSSSTKLPVVIAYTTTSSSRNVNYMVVRGGESFKISEIRDDVVVASIGTISGITSISIPYVVSDGATYYRMSYNESSKQYEYSYNFVSDLVKSVSVCVLGNNEIYYTGYCPTYIPDSSYTIDSPTEPSSFFNKNHPCNRFCMPYLKDFNVSISPLSITR